jgi:hypothetical protein
LTKALKSTYRLILSLFLLIAGLNVFAQPDSIPPRADSTKTVADSADLRVTDSTGKFVQVDTVIKLAPSISHNSTIDSILKYHSPRKAAIRSALVPGLGQIYNKKYWKVPIVYGALGVSASIFVYNLKWYRRTRFAYTAKDEALPKVDPITGAPITPDSTKYWQIHPSLINLEMNAIRSYRDEFRRNVDYSALFFLVIWGLNVVDATVDAHLKSFDVSPDLSFRLKFGQSPMAGTNGLSFILAFK